MLPPFVQRRLRALDAARDFGSAEYRALAKAMEARFTVRTYPPPDCYTRASGLMNDEIYVGIQGASEFTIGGVLAGWNITARLPALGALPTKPQTAARAPDPTSSCELLPVPLQQEILQL